MSKSFLKPKKQAKVIRLTGSLIINIDGKSMEVSNAFKIQTDIAYSGMSINEQETVLKAIETALSGKADISFQANLLPQEVKSNKPQEPTLIDQILDAANKPSEVDMVDAVVRDDTSKAESIKGAEEILGALKIPEIYGGK